MKGAGALTRVNYMRDMRKELYKFDLGEGYIHSIPFYTVIALAVLSSAWYGNLFSLRASPSGK